MHDELKPLVSMYHCCVEADERSKDQHNVLSAEDSVDQKFHGSTRSLMGAFLWVAIVFLVIGRRQQCRRLPTSSIRRSKKNPQTHPSAFPTTSESAHSRGPEGTLVCAIITLHAMNSVMAPVMIMKEENFSFRLVHQSLTFDAYSWRYTILKKSLHRHFSFCVCVSVSKDCVYRVT